MTKYDKEVDSRTAEYDDAIAPLDRATEHDENEPDEKVDDESAQ